MFLRYCLYRRTRQALLTVSRISHDQSSRLNFASTLNRNYPITSFKPHSQWRYSSSTHVAKFFDPNPLTAEAQTLLTALPDPHAQPLHDDIQKAFELLTDAMKQNSPRAKTLLASLYREGISVSKDVPTALRLFLEAAEEGDPIAQCSLGMLQLELIEQQTNNENEDVSGTELYVHTDEKGKQRAKIEMEMSDGEKLKEASTPAELVRKVRKARKKAGFTDAESREFEEYKEKEKLEKLKQDRDIALSWLQRAVNQGNTEAMVKLANEILNEKPLESIALYERAIKEDRNTDAYFNLGQVYEKGVEGAPQNEKLALKNFAMAAQLGDASAQFYLGHLYRIGSETMEVDLASSRQYIQLAVDQGHEGAEYYLALMYLNGEGGLEVNEGAFRRHLYASAIAGYGPANACLGDMHYKGSNGVKTNYDKALKYFLKAGELGEEDSLCSAAAMYFHGIGVKEDKHQAFLLYQEAVLLGSIQALRSIGSMYYHGHGVPVNKKLAAHFLDVADEREEMIRASEREHEKTPIRITDAPKHPMADIPRFSEKVNPRSAQNHDTDTSDSIDRSHATITKSD